ncbi:MAG: GNAT family N-acetyltransferase [Candidatus Brocadiales bacterium]|nr:GNAT family N-acetyltransferase [Candidatus Bathyanammoxibius sp.]
MPEIQKFLGHVSEPEELQEFGEYILGLMSANNFFYGVYDNKTLDTVGFVYTVSYTKFTVRPALFFHREYWNHKFAIEASNRMAEYLFYMGFKLIVVEVAKNNVPIIRVLRASGFVPSGALPGENSSEEDVLIFYQRPGTTAGQSRGEEVDATE